MIFEFIIIYQPREGEPILGVLRERLRDVLEANLNDVEEDALWRTLRITFERSRPADGAKPPRALLSFGVELPSDTASLRTVIDEFADVLLAEPVQHVVKFEDPLLHKELAERSEELFVLELKLRRVLSVIYLHAYEGEPYNLLREEKEKTQPATRPPRPTDMQEVRENEFFHLTFRQYGGLNKRPEVIKVPELKEVMKQVGTYAALCAELDRKPVLHSDDAGFLAGLRDLTHAIEAMRNCVAHYRRPSQKLTSRYLSELTQLHEALDLFLERNRGEWEDSLDTGPVEDWRAQEVIKYALENADWDEGARIIRLHTEEGHVIPVGSSEELKTELRRLCGDEWHNNAMKIDGEFVGICDESTWVSEALEDYDDRLENFFAAAEEEEDEEDGNSLPWSSPPA